MKPTSWESVGCSYLYNAGLFGSEWEWDCSRTRTNGAGLGGQSVNWVESPTRYILMFEAPARRDDKYFYHWHYRRGPSDIGPRSAEGWPELRRDTQRFISPIAFVDGHVAKHDFTQAIQANPKFCCEPTKDWVWYQPIPPELPLLPNAPIPNEPTP